MAHEDRYRQWPFLTDDEFALVCAFLDRRYISSRLGPTRRVFKIRSRWIATTGGCYIEITRLLQLSEDQDELSLALEKLNGSREEPSGLDMKMDVENEDEDQEALRPELENHRPGNITYNIPSQSNPFLSQPYVVYEIHLHPTYRMPTLWFTLHDLPMSEPTFDINSVYRYLVPEGYKSQLRDAGITGGISAAPHPVTDVPAFFIHPCQTKEAMEYLHCPMTHYLMVWLGLVGGCVGLWLPPEMAQEETHG